MTLSVEFGDDGAGLNLARIREQGVSQGLMTADQAMDDEAAANLIFLPGFSTAEVVTELAGRGIGTGCGALRGDRTGWQD